MESTFGESIDFEALDPDAIDTQDNVARGTLYALAFSVPLWAVIIAAIMALAG
jgi:hypothetical protein